MPIKYSFSKMSSPGSRRLMEYDPAILRLTRRLCKAAEYHEGKKGRVAMPELCRAVEADLGLVLNPTSAPAAGPFKRLMDAGALVRFRLREAPGAGFQDTGGGAYTYRVTDLDTVHVGVLLQCARAHTNPALEVRPGRKKSDDREVLEVKSTKDMETAVRSLVEHIFPWAKAKRGRTAAENKSSYDDALRRLDSTYMTWADGTGANGAGDWAILENEAKTAFAHLEKETQNKYIGSLRTLFDLGATHGYLLRRTLNGAPRTFLPTAWAEALNAWHTAFCATEHHNRSIGTAQLSRIMGALADTFSGALEGINPMALTEDQTRRFMTHFVAQLAADQIITKHQRSCVLATLRGLVSAGIFADVDIKAFDGRRKRSRKNAFPADVMRAIAEMFGNEKRLGGEVDYEIFLGLGKGRFFQAQVLVAGKSEVNRLSLPYLINWYTVLDTIERKRLGMKSVNAAARERIRGTGGLSGLTWVTESVEQHLELIGMYIGYLVRHHDLDLAGDWDASDVFTIEYLDAFIRAVDKHGWTSERRALDLIKNVSMYASPCWESGAVKMQRVASADNLQRLADYANGRGTLDGDTGTFDGLTLFKNRKILWAKEAAQLVDRMAAKSAAVQKAYEEAMGETYAYIGMLKIRNATISRFCREVAVERGLCNDGVVYVGEKAVLSAIEQRVITLTSTEFSIMRNLVMWGDGLVDPNRRKTVSQLDHTHRIENVRGELWAQVPAELMKVRRNGNHDLLLGTRDDVGVFTYRFDLWDAYKVAHRVHFGDVECAVMYPRTGTGKSTDPEDHRLAVATVTGIYRRVLEYGAAELKVDASIITSVPGASTSHAHRHAVASFMVGQDELDLARRMLHHAGVDLLLKVYARSRRPKSASGVLARVAA
jgi:hypothetical protein